MSAIARAYWQASQSSPRRAASIEQAVTVAFSIDDGPWQLGTTADGIFDDQQETLRLDLPGGLAKGTHALSVRVADAAGNVGAATTSFVR